MIWRGKLTRAVGTVCAGVVLTAGLAACGSDSGGGGGSQAAGSKKQVNVAHFIVVAANTHQQGMVKGADAAAKKLGNVKVRTFDGAFDPNKQVQQIDAAAATGQYDAFLVESVDGTRTVPAIKRAVAKGIKVVCAFSVCGPDQAKFAKELPEVSAQLGIDQSKLGVNGGTTVGEACKGIDPCKLVIMAGVAALVTEKWEINNLKTVLKDYPNVKVVATGEGGFLSDPAYKSMKDILQAHRDVNVVFSPGDQMIVGVEQAIDEAGLKGKVKLIGSGGSVLGTKAIQDGRWYASGVLRPYNDGYLGMTYAVKAARGEKVPALTDSQASDLAPNGFVTPDNVARWKPEWAG
jgi:ribose transport system substrate-binding protein